MGLPHDQCLRRYAAGSTCTALAELLEDRVTAGQMHGIAPKPQGCGKIGWQRRYVLTPEWWITPFLKLQNVTLLLSLSNKTAAPATVSSELLFIITVTLPCLLDDRELHGRLCMPPDHCAAAAAATGACPSPPATKNTMIITIHLR